MAEYISKFDTSEGAKQVDYNALGNLPSISSKTSDLQNDSGFLTEHQDLSGYATKDEIPKTASEVGADAFGTAESKVSEHNISDTAHNDIRLLVQGLTTRLNTLADSDDTTLDQMSEVVAYIKSNKSLIDAITTSKVNVSDIIDNLTTNVNNKPLSAAQGVKLKALIDAIMIPTKLSELENDSGYAKTTDIPDKLPNPQKLTFTGAVTAEYDGSAPLSVEIPAGGGFKSDIICDITTTEPVVAMSQAVDNKLYKLLFVHVEFQGVAGEANPEGITAGFRQRLCLKLSNGSEISQSINVSLVSNTAHWHVNFEIHFMPDAIAITLMRTEQSWNNLSAIKESAPLFIYKCKYEGLKNIKFSPEGDHNLLMTTGAKMQAWGLY